MQGQLKFVVMAFGLSVIAAANAGQTLYTPVEGAFIKDPNSITFQSLGIQTSVVSTLSLSGPNYTHSMGWFTYQKNLFKMPLPIRPPNNTWLTATLTDGATKSTRRLWTAFPYDVPNWVASEAGKNAYGSFPAGYCTNFAARAFFSSPEMNASYPAWSGHAKDWIAKASSAGWKTTSLATGGYIGAVIVWSGGNFGHVGVVVDMYQTGKPGEIAYRIEEMNWGPIRDSANAITDNFRKVTPVTLLSSNLNRAAGYPFVGFILPVRN